MNNKESESMDGDVGIRRTANDHAASQQTPHNAADDLDPGDDSDSSTFDDGDPESDDDNNNECLNEDVTREASSPQRSSAIDRVRQEKVETSARIAAAAVSMQETRTQSSDTPAAEMGVAQATHFEPTTSGARGTDKTALGEASSVSAVPGVLESATATGSGGGGSARDADSEQKVSSNRPDAHADATADPLGPTISDKDSKAQTAIQRARDERAAMSELLYHHKMQLPSIRREEEEQTAAQAAAAEALDAAQAAGGWFSAIPASLKAVLPDPSAVLGDVVSLSSSLSTSALEAVQTAFGATTTAVSSGLGQAWLSAEQFVDFVRARLAEPEELRHMRLLLTQHDLGEFALRLYSAPHRITTKAMVELISEEQIRSLAEEMGWTFVQRMSFLRACQRQRAAPTYFGCSITDCTHRSVVAG